MSPATESQQQVEDHEWRLRAIEALTLVARSVNRSLEPNEVLQDAVRAVGVALQLDGVVIRTLDAPTGKLTIAAADGVSSRFRSDLHVLEFGQGIAGEVVLTNSPIVVDDARDDSRLSWDAARDEELRSVAVVPIHARNSLIGTMATFTRAHRSFRADQLDLLQTIADQVGVALENARLYEAERTRSAELKRLHQLKSDFAATVSHELRTPMTVVKTAFDALTRDWERLSDERRFTYVQVGKRGADRLRQLLENVLLASRIESDRVPLRVRPTALREIVEQIACEASEQSGRNVYVIGSAPPPEALADGERLRQVLTHLVDNALRYSAGPVAIELAVERVDGKAQVAVRDSGIGIAADEMPRLFQRFERIDRTVRSQAGTGLGLYISRCLIEAMGGRIWAESQPGVGSSFFVQLPATN